MEQEEKLRECGGRRRRRCTTAVVVARWWRLIARRPLVLRPRTMARWPKKLPIGGAAEADKRKSPMRSSRGKITARQRSCCKIRQAREVKVEVGSEGEGGVEEKQRENEFKNIIVTTKANRWFPSRLSTVDFVSNDPLFNNQIVHVRNSSSSIYDVAACTPRWTCSGVHCSGGRAGNKQFVPAALMWTGRWEPRGATGDRSMYPLSHLYHFLEKRLPTGGTPALCRGPSGATRYHGCCCVPRYAGLCGGQRKRGGRPESSDVEKSQHRENHQLIARWLRARLVRHSRSSHRKEHQRIAGVAGR